eukprot:UC4_evm3s1162
MSEFVGYRVRIRFGDNHTKYEGKIKSVDQNRLVLIDATREEELLGLPVTLKASKIKDLQLLEEPISIKSSFPSEKNDIHQDVENGSMSSSKSIISEDLSKKGAVSVKSRPEKKNKAKQQKGKRRLIKDGRGENLNVSGSDLAAQFSQDFDFESNLAMFDKEKDFEEFAAMESNRIEDRLVTHNRRKPKEEKLGIHEMVLGENSRRKMKTIVHDGKQKFFTDMLLEIPEASSDELEKVYEIAEKAGVSKSQLVENGGRSICQMIFQLVGGDSRFSSHNLHQIPEIVVLAGSGFRSAIGICTARHLANHNVNVTLYVPNSDTKALGKIAATQLLSYTKTGGNIITAATELPNLRDCPIDVTVDSLEFHGSNASNNEVLNVMGWMSKSNNIISIDGPTGLNRDNGMVLSEDLYIKPRYSIAVGLPTPCLHHDNLSGQLYLADLGIPKQIFSEGSNFDLLLGFGFLIPMRFKAFGLLVFSNPLPFLPTEYLSGTCTEVTTRLSPGVSIGS